MDLIRITEKATEDVLDSAKTSNAPAKPLEQSNPPSPGLATGRDDSFSSVFDDMRRRETADERARLRDGIMRSQSADTSTANAVLWQDDGSRDQRQSTLKQPWEEEDTTTRPDVSASPQASWQELKILRLAQMGDQPDAQNFNTQGLDDVTSPWLDARTSLQGIPNSNLLDSAADADPVYDPQLPVFYSADVRESQSSLTAPTGCPDRGFLETAETGVRDMHADAAPAQLPAHPQHFQGAEFLVPMPDQITLSSAMSDSRKLRQDLEGLERKIKVDLDGNGEIGKVENINRALEGAEIFYRQDFDGNGMIGSVTDTKQAVESLKKRDTSEPTVQQKL